uniref:EFR3 homolog B n=1 Tax=Calidris pygmaea TaxID=425635 RepID=A0A8C3KB60_9CHAR
LVPGCDCFAFLTPREAVSTLGGHHVFFPTSQLHLPSFRVQPFPLLLGLPSLIHSPSPAFLEPPFFRDWIQQHFLSGLGWSCPLPPGRVTFGGRGAVRGVAQDPWAGRCHDSLFPPSLPGGVLCLFSPHHCRKPSATLITLLYFGSRSPSPLQATEKEKESPTELAERCLRELLGRAAYGNIKNAIKPVLIHLDNHSLWEPKIFATCCFRIIMYSIQPQHSHLVIQQLLGHLDANSKSAATVRAGIVEVLSEAAVIAASGSVGPTVLEVFNTLLRQLRLSIDYALTGSYDGGAGGGTKIIKEHEERMFQEAVIKTIGSFASTLPTYQQSEVMVFIMNKVPLPSSQQPIEAGKAGENRNRLTQIMLLKSLLQVSVGFQCSNMLTALPSAFLDRLLSAALMEDPEIRLFVLEILISFIDRHGNRQKFSPISTVSDISVLKLKVEKCSRQDTVFMKKHGQQLYRHIYLICKEESNVQAHYEALYSMLMLISIELANEEVMVDLIRLVLAVQEIAQINEDNLTAYNRCALFALGAAYLNLISQLTTVPTFCQHIHEVIQMRQKEAPYLLPEDVFVEKPRLSKSLDRLGPEVFFWQSKISEVLGGSGYNSDRLSTPYIPQLTDEDRLSKRKSIGETISLQVEVESRNSPEREQSRVPSASVDSVAVEEQERERRRQVVEKFQKAPFEEIAAHCGARATLLQSKLNQIFEITIRPPPSPSGTITAAYGQPQNHSIPVYEMKFPDLCVY